MDTYKIGNKVTGIIRAYSAGQLGAQYDNQPYTIIKGSAARLTFQSYEKTATARQDEQILAFEKEIPQQISLSDVKLNDKIMNLIYFKNETEMLCHRAETFTSTVESRIFLNNPSELYQVFIYDDEGNLELAFGTLTDKVVTVKKPESSYLVCYSYKGSKSYYLDKPQNPCVTLDLQIDGNVNDKTHPMFMHLEKCVVKVDKSMIFSQQTNTTTLTFIILKSDNNYLTIE